MGKSKYIATYAGPRGSWERNGSNLKDRKPINLRLQNLIDAASFYRLAHLLPPIQPVLGITPAWIDKREMAYSRNAMQILVAGGKLEKLALQLDVLRAERDAFLTLREVTD